MPDSFRESTALIQLPCLANMAQTSASFGKGTLRRLWFKVDRLRGMFQDLEPTFMPAKGWSDFNPRGGMVLVAICQPPRKLTHRQMMTLSLRDVSKIMKVTPQTAKLD